MNKGINRDVVKNCFAKGINTYNANAEAQREIAKRLVAYIIEHAKSTNFRNTLEIGCGTGFLTKELKKHITTQQFWLNDLVPECVEGLIEELPNCRDLSGNFETISIPSQLDSIVSASSFQWFKNLPKVLENIYHALDQEGILAFSSFGQDNFLEIRQTIGTGLDYHSLKDVQRLLELTGFEILHAESCHIIQKFDSPISVLRHMKATGVSGVSKPKRFSFKEFDQGYKNDFTTSGGGVSLTFHPIFFIARKV